MSDRRSVRSGRPDFSPALVPALIPARRTLSRRDLLKALPVAALAGAAACRRGPRPYDPARFAHPSTSTVALLPASRYDLDLSDVVGRGLALLKMDVRGKRVLLKPNMVEYAAEPRHQHASRAGGRRRAGDAPRRARPASWSPRGPAIAATSSTWSPPPACYDYLRDVGVRFVDLNHDDVRAVSLGSRFTDLAELQLPVELLAGGPGRVDAEAQDASLGRDDRQHEEPLRRRARRGLRLAEEHPPLARHRQLDRRPGRDHPARPGHRRRHRRHGRRRPDHGHGPAGGLRGDGAGSGGRGRHLRPGDGAAARADRPSSRWRGSSSATSTRDASSSGASGWSGFGRPFAVVSHLDDLKA